MRSPRGSRRNVGSDKEVICYEEVILPRREPRLPPSLFCRICGANAKGGKKDQRRSLWRQRRGNLEMQGRLQSSFPFRRIARRPQDQDQKHGGRRIRTRSTTTAGSGPMHGGRTIRTSARAGICVGDILAHL
eukprot:5197200-Pyramimonas_sp.AAC.1